MKRLKKSLLIVGTMASVGMGGLGVVGAASAATSSTTSSTSIIDKLVAKFGLNKDEVTAVFQEDRAAHEAEHLASLKTKLATAVTDGKLTQAQSDAIVAKYNELQTQRTANKDKMDSMTDTERKAAMDATRAALDKWIADNNIPAEYARLIHMGGHGGHDGDMTPSTSSTTTN